jgi:mono/diheme cytochrome c family protein
LFGKVKMWVRRKGGVMSSNMAKRSCAGALMISACLLSPSAIAQQTAPQGAPKPVAKDTYQRSLATYEFRKAAGSGPERGREIFYYKCWFCHNEFTKNAPQLTGLYQRGTLLSGLPVNDDNVKDRIRNGGAGMAAYKYTLSEADLNDLVSFVRDKCCWDSDAPPLNPRYGAR